MFRKAVLVLLLAVPLAFAHQDFQETRSEVLPFHAGNALNIEWKVGDLRIVKGADADHLHIRYTIRSNRESNLRDANVEFRNGETGMTIESHSPSMGNTSIDAEIEVPDAVNLHVSLKVGDLEVTDIKGDKDLDVGVGDVQVSAPADYRSVHAKTGIGDVDWSPSGVTTEGLRESGWIGHKLTYSSNGKYELRAHVGVGDINIR